MAENYVDKEKLHDALCKHIEKVKEAEKNGLEPPVANNYIGQAIILIATNIATKFNFKTYTWKDEMIGDGILAAVKAINKYDPERSQNPYGFFSQAIWWSFQARIKIEKAKLNNQYEMMKDVLLDFHTDGMDSEIIIDRNNLISMMEI